MTIYAEIAVNVPQVMGLFHYHLPPEIEDMVVPGCLVTVPFGSQTVYGVVLNMLDAPGVENTRPVLELVDDVPALTPVQIELANWISSHTLAPLVECISAILPPGLSQQADTLYQLRDGSLSQSGEFSPLQLRLINLLKKRGSLRGRQIDAGLPRQNWRSSAQSLVRQGLLNSRSVLPPPRVQPKTVRTARLACPPHVARSAILTLGEPVRKLAAITDLENAQAQRHHLGREGSTAASRRWSMFLDLFAAREPVLLKDLYQSTGGNSSDVDRLVQAGLAEVVETPSPVMYRRQAILDFMIREPGDVDVTWLYAQSGGGLSDLYQLEERGLIMLGESEIFRDPLADIEFVLSDPPQLTPEQETAWEVIHTALQNTQEATQSAFQSPGQTSVQTQASKPILLHGVTGSGKTELYLRAVEYTLAQGRQVIVLVPEIALTPQTVRRFINRFPGQVGLVHSGLSEGERYDTWRRARSGKLSIVVGPRSALFTPFPDVGLVVIDEFHDPSYYQSDARPHYHARDTAIAYSRFAGAVCLMGSATPDLVSYTRIDKSYTYVQLPSRILAHKEAVRAQMQRIQPQLQAGAMPSGSGYHHLQADADTIELPPVEVVDMRTELKSGNRSIFSRSLQSALGDVFQNNQQAILFLNRRGTATYVFCRDCGFVVKCPRCDLPLTYHTHTAEPFHSLSARHPIADQSRLDCHHCGYRRKMPGKCPQCGGANIRHFGTGTERVAEEVSRFFPDARILRWDWETTRQKGAHEIILSHFTSHRADILVGTQMLAKGLDLPLVTLVGVVLADVGLSMPDYASNERTFQVLSQVAGRAGRSPLGGKVVLQTFQPDHFVIQSAAQHDFVGFARQELEYRRKLGYPPFAQLIRLEVRSTDPAEAETAARQVAGWVSEWMREDHRKGTQMLGPYPPFFARLGGLYRWHIILRGPDPLSVIRRENRLGLLTAGVKNWHIEVNPPTLL